VTQNHYFSILQLIIPVLGLVKVPQDLEQKDKMFIFKEKPDVAKLFLDFILDVLLMPYRYKPNHTEICRQAGRQAGTTLQILD